MLCLKDKLSGELKNKKAFCPSLIVPVDADCLLNIILAPVGCALIILVVVGFGCITDIMEVLFEYWIYWCNENIFKKN